MVDVLGTWNKLTWVGELQVGISITNVATDKALGSITLPNIANATIRMVRLRFVAFAYNNTTPVNISPTQYIQVQKGAAGWNNAIKIPTGTMGFNSGSNESGIIAINGSIDVSSIVDVFNQAYTFQWDEAKTSGAGTISFSGIQMELDIWYTLDSGVEDKIDIIDTNVDQVKIDTTALKQVTLFGGGAVVFSVVANGANTALSFETDIPPGWGNDYFNDMQFVIYDPAVIPAFQARRISAFNATTQFLTLDTALDSIPGGAEKFRIVTLWTPAIAGGNDWTVGERQNIRKALGVAGTKAATSGGNLDDVLADTDEIQGKLPSKSTLRGTADVDGGMDTEDKADINAEADQALADYDPPTRTEATADKDEIIVEVDANEAKIDTAISDIGTHDTDIKNILGTPIVDIITDINNRLDTIDTNIQANYDAIILIQNNVSTVLTGPKKLIRPDSGTKPYRYFVFNYDNVGNMEDFNADPTLTGTYISGGGPYFGGTMTRDGIGQYHFDVNVAFDDTLGAIQVKLDAVVAGTLAPRVVTITSEVSDYDDELQEIFDLVEATHTKVDAATPSPTIPEQLTTMETNLTAEIDENQVIVETIRDDMEAEITYPNPAFIGSGYSLIDSENPIAIGSSTIPLLPGTGETFNPDGGSIKLSKGEAEEESVVYTGIVDDVMTLSAPTANEHQPNASVYEITKLNFHMTIRRKDGDVNIQADSLPTYSIVSVIGGSPDGSGSMTWEASTARYVATVDYDIDIEASQRVGTIDVVVDTKTRDFTFDFELMERPSTERQINEAVGSAIPPNTIVFDHNGWYDEFGIKHLWTDEMAGAIKDDAGQPVILRIKAYLYDPVDVNVPILGPNPRYDNWTNQFGHYVGGLPAGKYLFTFIANGKKWKQVDRYIDYP